MRKLLFAVMGLLVMGLVVGTDISFNEATAGTSVSYKGAQISASAGEAIFWAPPGGVITSVQIIPSMVPVVFATEHIQCIVYVTSGGSDWVIAGVLTEEVTAGTDGVDVQAAIDTTLHIALGGVKGVKLVGTYCLEDSVVIDSWVTAVTYN